MVQSITTKYMIHDLLLPAGIIRSHRSRTRFKYFDGSLTSHNNTKTRRGAKSFLGSREHDVNSPCIHLDLLGCYRAYSVQDYLFIVSMWCHCHVHKSNTKVSGETLLVVSAIAFASDNTADRND
jgi:hypothetical protein